MNLKVLDVVVAATRSKRIIWKRIGPEEYETLGDPKVAIRFEYPQVGGNASTGADVAVVTLGNVTASFFSGTEGMIKIGEILRAAFPEWEKHQAEIERKIDDFIDGIQKIQQGTPT